MDRILGDIGEIFTRNLKYARKMNKKRCGGYWTIPFCW